MSHVRQQIRDAVQALLTDAVTDVDDRVYINRVYNIASTKLPLITVSAGSETSSVVTMSTLTVDRSLEILVDVYADATSLLDDTIDDLCSEVEQLMGDDQTLGGLTKECILISTNLNLSGDAETPIGVARLNYRVKYIAAITDVETPL
jgi:hypothetical protein